MQPANLRLLFATEEDVRGMRPIKVLDTMEGMTKNFHPDGLFSTDIFGKVGGEFRNRLYSYIDLKVPVIHPTLYKVIVRMKSLYEDILMGKAFATYDPEAKDFVKSTIMLGETGFDFFTKHMYQLSFAGSDARSRKEALKLLQRYKNNYVISRLVVLPAGLRDYFVDETGKPGEDEINEFYKKIMKTVFSLETIVVDGNLEYLDAIRSNLQSQIQLLYEHIITMLKGKKGAIQSHWTTRRIVNSTRNVITSHIPAITELGGHRSVGSNQTVIGLYQFLRAAIPLAIKDVREKFSQRVFIAQNAPAMLINKKTLKREQVQVDSYYYDSWLTYDGLEKIFANFGDLSIRHKVLEIEGYYMGLVYRGPDKTFKLIFDLDEIPEDRREGADIKPVTLLEMLYICVYEMSRSIMAFITRYPVAGYGGISPCETYLRSTEAVEILYELDEFWQPRPFVAGEFPVLNSSTYDSMSLPATRLAAAGADYDGDKMSYIAVWTEDAREELQAMLNKWEFYISSEGKMSFSMSDDVIDLILESMTKKVRA